MWLGPRRDVDFRGARHEAFQREQTHVLEARNPELLRWILLSSSKTIATHSSRIMTLIAAYEVYTPMESSPLNPHACARRRKAIPQRGRIALSPCEKLLRRKAAEAWKSEIIYRQVCQYEQVTVDALKAARVVVTL